METDEMSDLYFTYDSRLESFRSTQPAPRGANAKGRAKVLSWPHKQLDPDVFARAGFYFKPSPESPDNTVCFLCRKAMKGWEKDDDPFEEHLRLSPHCGWAIVGGIEHGLGDYGGDDPASSAMVEARKATFGGRWPHEGKRGWKCKTKQLVDAGWKYTPTAESDDMATCTYCSLALDGWEPKDNPLDEHYRRSSDCQFFVLTEQYISAKKKGRGKSTSTSRSLRLSTQSSATLVSEGTSADNTLDFDDSVVTNSSIMTATGTKRATKAKKAPAAKAKKTRTKKVEINDEPEVFAIEARGEQESMIQEESIKEETPEVVKKPRGRKRGSAAVEDSVLAAAEAPAPKKRATRGKLVSAKAARPSIDQVIPDPVSPEAAMEVDVKPEVLETEMDVDVPEPAPAPKRGRPAGTRKATKQTTRKTKAKAKASVEVEPEPDSTVDATVDELAEGHDTSVLSNGSGIRTSLSSVSGVRKRGRLSKQSIISEPETESTPAVRPSIETEEPVVEQPAPAKPELEAPATRRSAVSHAAKTPSPLREVYLPPPVPESAHIQRPSTPEVMVSPSPAANQAVVSPSQTPQSSNAENHPPSSKPSNTSRSARVALEPTTPVQSSPSKRSNAVVGLETTHEWSEVDIETILDDLDRENSLSTSRYFQDGVELSTPEKQMTVEEWIFYNAEQAEKKLKSECEAMVMAFEREGTRAMQALEGLVIEESA